MTCFFWKCFSPFFSLYTREGERVCPVKTMKKTTENEQSRVPLNLIYSAAYNLQYATQLVLSLIHMQSLHIWIQIYKMCLYYKILEAFMKYINNIKHWKKLTTQYTESWQILNKFSQCWLRVQCSYKSVLFIS